MKVLLRALVVNRVMAVPWFGSVVLLVDSFGCSCQHARDPSTGLYLIPVNVIGIFSSATGVRCQVQRDWGWETHQQQGNKKVISFHFRSFNPILEVAKPPVQVCIVLFSGFSLSILLETWFRSEGSGLGKGGKNCSVVFTIFQWWSTQCSAEVTCE